MNRPLVSVITPTWQRHDLLLETIEDVRRQTYRPIEHVVVADGIDPELRMLIEGIENEGDVPIVFTELGRNWSTFLPDSFCAAPAVVAQLLASGAYQCTWADDERATPDHIESLVDLVERIGADFAYSKVRMHHPEQPPEQGYVIGEEPPSCGQITNVLYRAELLQKGLYPFNAGMTSDWTLISGWLSRGARIAFLDRVTMSHAYNH